LGQLLCHAKLIPSVATPAIPMIAVHALDVVNVIVFR